MKILRQDFSDLKFIGNSILACITWDQNESGSVHSLCPYDLHVLTVYSYIVCYDLNQLFGFFL